MTDLIRNLTQRDRSSQNLQEEKNHVKIHKKEVNWSKFARREQITSKFTRKEITQWKFSEERKWAELPESVDECSVLSVEADIAR